MVCDLWWLSDMTYMWQTPSLIIQPLPPYSARYSYATKRGTTQSSMHLSTERAPFQLLVIVLDQSFSSAGVRKRISEFCAQRCFKCFVNWWLEISLFSHMSRVSWWSAISLSKQMLGELSCSLNIRHVHFKHEIVLPQFQWFNIISGGTITMSSYNVKAWYNLSYPLQTYCHLSVNAKLSASWRLGETYGIIKNGSGRKKNSASCGSKLVWNPF